MPDVLELAAQPCVLTFAGIRTPYKARDVRVSSSLIL
jgi:hypothetical protein